MEENSMTKGAIITLPLSILRRWASRLDFQAPRTAKTELWASERASQPPLSLSSLYQLNGVCAKVELGQYKARRSLLGCHIQLTVSASSVSC